MIMLWSCHDHAWSHHDQDRLIIHLVAVIDPWLTHEWWWWSCSGDDHSMIRIGLLYILLLWLTHDDDDDHALGMITAWSWSWMWVIMHDHVILSNSVLHSKGIVYPHENWVAHQAGPNNLPFNAVLDVALEEVNLICPDPVVFLSSSFSFTHTARSAA